jgi:hypothetical protein
MDWLAHSFLAATPFDGPRRVLPLVGFSWGFEIWGSHAATLGRIGASRLVRACSDVRTRVSWLAVRDPRMADMSVTPEPNKGPFTAPSRRHALRLR